MAVKELTGKRPDMLPVIRTITPIARIEHRSSQFPQPCPFVRPEHRVPGRLLEQLGVLDRINNGVGHDVKRRDFTTISTQCPRTLFI